MKKKIAKKKLVKKVVDRAVELQNEVNVLMYGKSQLDLIIMLGIILGSYERDNILPAGVGVNFFETVKQTIADKIKKS
jgi:hypothetical protein